MKRRRFGGMGVCGGIICLLGLSAVAGYAQSAPSTAEVLLPWGVPAQGAATAPATTAPTTPTARRTGLIPDRMIENSIRRGVAYLYSKENKAGNWEQQAAMEWDPAELYAEGPHTYTVQYGGTTALCVFALLSAGESPSDPRLAPAIAFLKKAPMNGIYAISLRLNAMALLPINSVREQMRTDLATLTHAMIVQPAAERGHPPSPDEGIGLYRYSDKQTSGRPDHSVSQFGILGVWIAAQRGLDPGEPYWQAAEKAWLNDQEPDGGWCYAGRHGATTGSMTVAGLATLFIAEDELHSLTGIDCKGNSENPAIERGLKWLGDNFATVRNPGSNDSPYYYLFGVQRVGVASGYRYFGAHDWYNEGAATLLSLQGADGAWPYASMQEPVHTTSFALLFLSRGNRPQLINKLRYEGAWQQRPRDVANLARWFGFEYEREFGWQIVDIQADPEDFHNSPLLYLSGHGALNFTDGQKAKLRAYVEGGGILLGNADCGSEEFAKSFQQLQGDLFPQYAVRALPADHLIFGYQPLKKPPVILGQSNGVRELSLLVPSADLGRALQRNRPAATPDDFNTAGNICLYAGDPSTIQWHNAPYFVRRNDDLSGISARPVRLARLRYEGNWDPEPGGWVRIGNLLHNQYAIDLEVEPVTLGAGKLGEYKFAHLTGTTALKLNEDQLNDIKVFLSRGGTLLMDAAGGSEAFGESMQQMLEGLIPHSSLEAMPLDDPLLGAPKLTRWDERFSIGGGLPFSMPPLVNLTTQPNSPATGTSASDVNPSGGTVHIAYRRFARGRVGEAEALRLRGIRFGGRWIVIFSGEDLSAGLVGQNVDGIIGYTPACATELVRRILVNRIEQLAGDSKSR